ncbi:hypothetical protein D3C81_2196110 [compost metagenome]
MNADQIQKGDKIFLGRLVEPVNHFTHHMGEDMDQSVDLLVRFQLRQIRPFPAAVLVN